MIQTVLGEIKREELGVTYMHEHLHADLSGVRADSDSLLTNTAEIIEEVYPAVQTGVQSFVDVSCIGMGRNPEELAKISIETKSNIICSTGFYLPSYYPDYVHTESADQLAQRLINDITIGIGDTGIKCGIIGEIATAKNEFTEVNRKIFLASAIAHKVTGVPITTHCSAATMGYEQAAFLIENGVSPHKIVIGHQDLSNDTSLIIKILALGVAAGFDTIGKQNYLSDEHRAKMLVELIEAGFIEQIILSEDISRRSYYRGQGGHGYAYLNDEFLPRLKSMGITEKQIEQMLIENPAGILDVDQVQDDRLTLLLKTGVISHKAFHLTGKYMQFLTGHVDIAQSGEHFTMFVSHLAICFERMTKNEPISECPEVLEQELSSSKYYPIARWSFLSFCSAESIAFSEIEAMYLTLHLGLLLEQSGK